MKILSKRITEIGAMHHKFNGHTYVEYEQIAGDMPYRRFQTTQILNLQLRLQQCAPKNVTLPTGRVIQAVEVTDDMLWENVEVSDDFGNDYRINPVAGERLIIPASDPTWSIICHDVIDTQRPKCPLIALWRQMWDDNWKQGPSYAGYNSMQHPAFYIPSGSSADWGIPREHLKEMNVDCDRFVRMWKFLRDWTHCNTPTPSGWYTPRGLHIPKEVTENMPWKEILLYYYYKARSRIARRRGGNSKWWDYAKKLLLDRWQMEMDEGEFRTLWQVVMA